MPTIQEEIEKGLYRDNLSNLIKQSVVNFETSPVLNLILNFIFRDLQTAYDNNEISLEEINPLKPLILTCIKNPTMPSLEQLARKYWKIME